MQYEQEACQTATGSSSHRLIHMEYGCFVNRFVKVTTINYICRNCRWKTLKIYRKLSSYNRRDIEDSSNYQDSNLEELTQYHLEKWLSSGYYIHYEEDFSEKQFSKLFGDIRELLKTSGISDSGTVITQRILLTDRVAKTAHIISCKGRNFFQLNMVSLILPKIRKTKKIERSLFVHEAS